MVMPVDVLTDDEIKLLFKKARIDELSTMVKPSFAHKLAKTKNLSNSDKKEMLIGINETLRNYLPLRDTDKISTSKNKYSRRIH
jgi:hypothetical protein